MATHDYVIANGTGAAVRSDLNNALAAIVSNNSGSSEPGTTYAYQWWADTNANVLKIRNSANNAWITLRELDGTMLIEDGSASTPGLAFADDVNTGIFSPAADQIGFATGGAERLEIGDSEVVFNDPSNDVDFRVESNGNTHMLFVDAGNNAVVIGGNSALTSDTQLTLTSTTTSGGLGILSPNDGRGDIFFGDAADDNIGQIKYSHSNDSLTFRTNASDAVVIDSSGRLLVGTSSAINTSNSPSLEIVDTGTAVLSLGRDDSTISAGNALGSIKFFGNDGGSYQQCAEIAAAADGTHANDDKPTRLVFSTTADGASSPTERMQIDSSGFIHQKFTSNNSSTPEGLFINNQNNGTGNNASLIFSNDSGNRKKVAIAAVDVGNYGASDLVFALDGADTGSVSLSTDEKMRLDSSGRLLVGASSAAGSGSLAQYAKLVLRGDTTGSTSAGIINLARGAGAASMSSGNSAGVITFSDSAGLEFGDIGFNCDDTPSGSSTPGRFVVKTTASGATTPTERMRIDKNGFQASTSTNHGIEMGITAASSSLNTIFRGRFGATAGSFATGTISFNVFANGDVTNTNNSYTAISDINLKENIVPASSQWDNIKDIEVVNYNFKEETGHQTHKQLGVIAQQVEEVSPGLVKDGEEGLKTVNYSVLYMKAVKALQEAMGRIETLEAKVAALEAG